MKRDTNSDHNLLGRAMLVGAGMGTGVSIPPALALARQYGLGSVKFLPAYGAAFGAATGAAVYGAHRLGVGIGQRINKHQGIKQRESTNSAWNLMEGQEQRLRKAIHSGVRVQPYNEGKPSEHRFKKKVRQLQGRAAMSPDKRDLGAAQNMGDDLVTRLKHRSMFTREQKVEGGDFVQGLRGKSPMKKPNEGFNIRDRLVQHKNKRKQELTTKINAINASAKEPAVITPYNKHTDKTPADHAASKKRLADNVAKLDHPEPHVPSSSKAMVPAGKVVSHPLTDAQVAQKHAEFERRLAAVRAKHAGGVLDTARKTAPEPIRPQPQAPSVKPAAAATKAASGWHGGHVAAGVLGAAALGYGAYRLHKHFSAKKRESTSSAWNLMEASKHSDRRAGQVIGRLSRAIDVAGHSSNPLDRERYHHMLTMKDAFEDRMEKRGVHPTSNGAAYGKARELGADFSPNLKPYQAIPKDRIETALQREVASGASGAPKFRKVASVLAHPKITVTELPGQAQSVVTNTTKAASGGFRVGHAALGLGAAALGYGAYRAYKHFRKRESTHQAYARLKEDAFSNVRMVAEDLGEMAVLNRQALFPKYFGNKKKNRPQPAQF